MENTTVTMDPLKNLIVIHFSSNNTCGSLNELGNIIKTNNINISAQDVVITMSKYLKNLTDIQENVFKAYFWRQATIVEIYEQYNFDLVESAKKCLVTATSKYIDMIRADYGTK